MRGIVYSVVILGLYLANCAGAVLKRLLYSMLLLSLVLGACTASHAEAKNVILMICDGWGYNQILAADYYQHGKAKSQVYESFPVSCAMSTFPGSTSPKPLAQGESANCTYEPLRAISTWDYIKLNYTDSAAAGTAMACGVKTYNKSIGKDLYGRDLKNVSQSFKEAGRAAGVVTNVPWSHATPACFVAHNVTRDNYAEIANEMVNGDMDVIMGAGHPYYSDDGIQTAKPNRAKNQGKSIEGGYVGGLDTWKQASAGSGKGWTFVQTKEQVQALATGDTPARVLATFQVATTTQQARSGPAFYTTTPYEAALNQNVPSLGEISLAALNVLDNNPKGFFLMIEGGAIDWACHMNQRARLIEEMTDFNKAVESVIDWIEHNSNWNDTLLIVTGDHETGMLTGPDKAIGSGGNPAFIDVVSKGVGVMPDMQFNYWEHTNSLIPLFAKGNGSEMFSQYAVNTDTARGKYIDNIDLYKVMVRSSGVNP